MNAIAVDQGRRLLARMKGRRVLVVGDLMLDEFVWGRVSRISPEAPVPVVEVTRETRTVGGAGNVANNVQALGGHAVLVGYVGDDAAGADLRQALVEAGVEAHLVSSGKRPTTLKTRIIAHHQQVVRADRDPKGPLPDRLDREVALAVKRCLSSCDAVIVSDYAKGLVSRRLMRELVARARRAGVRVLVDPKVRQVALYRRASVLTPNQAEAEAASGIRIVDEDSLRRAGEVLVRRLACEAVLVTRGEHGMTLFAPPARPYHVPTAAREVFDVTGAGDTVIAALGLALAARAGLRHAAVLANHAASVVVSKLGTATASPGEVIAALRASRR